MSKTRWIAPALAALLTFSLAPAARAGKVDKTVPFALDHWIELESTDGPVTLHRIQIERQTGTITKSTFIRPKGSDFLDTVQIRIEYSNKDKHKDWEAHLDIAWLDAAGEVIDGYVDKENIDNDKFKDKIHVTLSTLKYGLHRAKSLRIRIDYVPE